MNDWIIDSSVFAKWILPEADSAHAQELITESARTGGRLIVLDLAFPEVANAIWKRHRQKLISLEESRTFIRGLMTAPVHIERSLPLLPSAVEIATTHDRAVYDALFVALSHQFNLPGITADEPLYNAVHPYFPQITLLRNWKP